LALRWQRQVGQPAWVMGVLNCTPDSFSDGDADADVASLVCRAHEMVTHGANIIDVGGESTRPGAAAVALDVELARVIPVIQALTDAGLMVSVDTMKAEVMRQSIAAGAVMVNDVSALTFDDASMAVVAEAGVDVCLMHMLGSPENMQHQPEYTDVLAHLSSYFEQRIQACLAAGIAKSSLLLDVGIGFGKHLQDNLTLIAHLEHFKTTFSLPIVLGTSRKSFLGLMTGAKVQHREVETAITSAIGVFCGADMIRVHDCALQSKTAVIAGKLRDARQAIRC